MNAALVTGAASGIGRATALELQARDWRVYATDVDGDALDRLPPNLRTFELDVTSTEACAEAVERVVDEAGSIDLLVNNAGDSLVGAVESLEVEDVRRQFDVNLHGPHRLTREVLPHMRERGRGTVVNVSSVLGRVSLPGAGSYCASKHALEALSDALRVEVAGYGVDVVLVEPAGVATGFEQDALDGLDREGVYADLHRSLERLAGLLMRRPLACESEDVAGVVADAAEADDPRARYRVGRGAGLLTAAGHVPSRARDAVHRAVSRL
ncbi:MAG: SDR family oxidoreductase [Halobacteriota archaeon]